MVDSVVSLLPAATEILFEIGAGDKVRAVSHECDTPSEAADLPSATRTRIDAGGSGREIDETVRAAQDGDEPLYEVLEEVLHHAQPDLVIAQDACSVCGVTPVDVEAAMSRIEPVDRPEVLSLHPHTLADVIGDVRRVADAVGAPDDGKRVAHALELRVEAVRALVDETGGPTPRVAVLDWIDPPMAAGHWIPGMVEDAGGRPVLVEDASPSRYVDFHEVVDAGPEVLALAPCGFDADEAAREAKRMRELDGWASLPAVRDGRVVALDADAYTSRPGPRLVDGLEQLACAVLGEPARDAYPEQAERVRPVV